MPVLRWQNGEQLTLQEQCFELLSIALNKREFPAQSPSRIFIYQISVQSVDADVRLTTTVTIVKGMQLLLSISMIHV